MALQGNALDIDPGPRARLALDNTLAALRPDCTVPSICAAIEKLEVDANDGRNARLETTLADIADLRVQLRESAAVSPQVREHVENAYHDISYAYLLQNSKAA